MDFVIVCKPAWWGTSSRIPDTAGYMAGTANKNDTKRHESEKSPEFITKKGVHEFTPHRPVCATKSRFEPRQILAEGHERNEEGAGNLCAPAAFRHSLYG